MLSLAVARLQPLMIAAAQASGSVDNAVLDELTTWDAKMGADRPEPLIFTAWMRAAVKAIYRDDLGPAFDRYFNYRALALIRLLEGRATARDWCDDRTTPERESCGSVLAAALNDALKAMGMTCMSTVGGSSGPVFGTLLVTLGKELPPEPGPDDLAQALAAAIAALSRLGKVEVGHKTLLDVLDPVQKVIAAGGDDLVARVRQCAHDSAAATAQMDAIKGRASFLGERALGHVDPGSRSMALIIAAVCDTL